MHGWESTRKKQSWESMPLHGVPLLCVHPLRGQLCNNISPSSILLAMQKWCPIEWREWWTLSHHWLRLSSSWLPWIRTVTAQTRSNRGSPPHRCPVTTWTHMVSMQRLAPEQTHKCLSLDQPCSSPVCNMCSGHSPRRLSGFSSHMRLHTLELLCFEVDFQIFVTQFQPFASKLLRHVPLLMMFCTGYIGAVLS